MAAHTKIPAGIDLEKITDERSKDLLTSILRRHTYHVNAVADVTDIYIKSGFFLNVGIPILAAIVTYMTSINQSVAAILGLILTIMTILNSIFKPAEKYVSSARTLVYLNDWEVSLAIGLKNLDSNNVEELDKFLVLKNKEISELGSTVVETFIPQVANT